MKNKITKIEITDLKLKSNKVKQLLDFEDSNILDKIVGSGVNKASIAEMKYEKDTEEYISLLRKKYKFAAFDCFREEDYFTKPILFKIIKVMLKRKKYMIYLVLLEYTNLLKHCTTSYNNATQNA